MPDTTRRLTPKRLAADLQALRGLRTIDRYAPLRDYATPEALQQSYQAMKLSQEEETIAEIQLKAARDKARQAEWNFHLAVLAMKQCVLGQFGPDSDEIQAVGYKKKGDRQRGRRSSSIPDPTDAA